MTDQCKHCALRGDLALCKAAECFHHENWYAIEQQKLIDLTQAKYAAVCQELECAQNDIELRDREIQALKYKNTLEAAKHAELMVMIPKLKAEAIRESVQCAGSFWSSDIGDLIVRHDTLLVYADKLEQGQ